MFGVIVSGRPVLTEAQQITPTQFAFQLPSAPSFNHLVVFLLPGTALPPDTAAAVYVQLPPAADFKFLGAIANEKQSAIFKVDGIDAVSALNGGAGVPVTLGISVEPVAQIQQAMAAKQQQQQQQQAAAGVTGSELVRAGVPKNPATTKVLAQRIIANAFNFLASFAGNTANGVEVVPLKSFQDWWTKFEKKIEMDPGFLERGDQG